MILLAYCLVILVKILSNNNNGDVIKIYAKCIMLFLSSINRQAPLNGCIRVSVHITAIFALSTPLELAPRSIKCLFK